MPPEISIIIPAHNMGHTIGDCLSALNRQTIAPGRYEIIVIDDRSTDNTAEIAHAHGATVIRKDSEGWAGAARNIGIKAAQGKLACFTDADCSPHPTWLSAITQPLANPDISGVKGTYSTQQQRLFARFVQVEYEEKYEHLKGKDRIAFIDFYSAAFRREVLLDNNGFDERFPNSEDRELSFRLATQGYQMVFQPSAVVQHLHADSFYAYFTKKVRNGYWTAQVVRLFPTHRADDSYTPQTQKLQIGLMGLFYIALAGMVITQWSGLLALLLLLTFDLTTLPFIRHAWSRDKIIALLAPLLLAIRATALGIGYVWGIIRPLNGHFSAL